MKIVLCSIGKNHEAYIKEGVAEFTQRISHYFPVEWQLLAPPRNASVLSDAELKKKEALLVDNFLQKEDMLLLLDEKGKMLSSPALASLIADRAEKGTKRLVFLIGGAFGVDDSVFRRAAFVWKLSDLVFPHMLVRLILAEQVYRACTIIRGEKYHHA